MMKNFDEWNLNKKKINNSKKHILYHKRDIWWCNLGINIGYEQDGTGNFFDRPVLILKDFNQFICLIIPLTTSTKTNKYYIGIGLVEGKKAKAIISQVKLIDTKRLVNKIGMINKSDFNRIRKAVRNLI